MREYGVNLYFYKKGDECICIDSGYLEYPLLKEKLHKIGIRPERINTILLTYADPDHAGGIDDRGNRLFMKAKVYVGEIENRYVQHEKSRKLLHLKSIRRPLISNELIPLIDGENFQVGNINVKAFHIPGHTEGHSGVTRDKEKFFRNIDRQLPILTRRKTYNSEAHYDL